MSQAVETSQQSADPEQLHSLLEAQRGPLAHVEAAFKQGWSLIGSELEQARVEERRPDPAWRHAFQFLKGIRGETGEQDHVQLVDDYRQALELQERGLEQISADPFGDHEQYLQRMGRHLEPYLARTRQAEGECLRASEVVAAKAMESGDEGLEEMDRTLTVLGMALSSLLGRGRDYIQRLEGHVLGRRAAPAEAELLSESAPTLAPVLMDSPDEALLRSGPDSMAPAALRDYYLRTYGVELDFEPDGRPILPSLDGPVHLQPGAGLGAALEPEPEHAHGF